MHVSMELSKFRYYGGDHYWCHDCSNIIELHLANNSVCHPRDSFIYQIISHTNIKLKTRNQTYAVASMYVGYYIPITLVTK